MFKVQYEIIFIMKSLLNLEAIFIQGQQNLYNLILHIIHICSIFPSFFGYSLEGGFKFWF